LTFQPGTDLLFGISTYDEGIPCAGCLYTIDTTSAEATYIGWPGWSNGGLAFAPDGTLYLAYNWPNPYPNGPYYMDTLNPSDGTVLASEQIVFDPPILYKGIYYYSSGMKGLGARPSDGVLFSSFVDYIYKRDPNTATWSVLGIPITDNIVTDIAFRPDVTAVGEPGTFLLLCSGLAGLGLWRRSLTARPEK